MRAGNQIFDESPFVGERSSAVKTHGISAERFRGHIEIVVPAEHVWIRKMKRFLQDDSFVVPGETVAAGGAADIALVGLVIQDLKKHVPEAIDIDHKRISDKARGNICYVGGGNYRVQSAGSSAHAQGRCAGIHGNGPCPRPAGIF